MCLHETCSPQWLSAEMMLGHVKYMQSHDGGAHLPLGGASTRCQKAEGRLLRGLASTCKLLRGKVKRQADRDGTQTCAERSSTRETGTTIRQRKRTEAFCTVIPGHDRCMTRKRRHRRVAATLGVAAHLASHRSLATCFAIRYRNTSRYVFHGERSSATVAGWAT